jgi:glutathione peroxidase
MSRIFSLTLWVFLMATPVTSLHAHEPQNAYEFSFHALQGAGEIPLSQFKDDVILVVNTASQCGFTGQYDGLEKLYQTYHSRGFVIIGVPSNDFGDQEPGSGSEIAHFCKLNFGVSFPMSAKENVTGSEAHPFYKWARSKFGWPGAPKWNFHKYLIGRNGELVDYFYSFTKPDNENLLEAIETLLNSDQNYLSPAAEEK